MNNIFTKKNSLKLLAFGLIAKLAFVPVTSALSPNIMDTINNLRIILNTQPLTQDVIDLVLQINKDLVAEVTIDAQKVADTKAISDASAASAAIADANLAAAKQAVVDAQAAVDAFKK